MTEQDPFTVPDAGRARAHRTHAALTRITERHAGDDTRRRRYAHPYVPDPYEAVALVTALAAGGAELAPDEEPVDDSDLVAALTLVPHLRAEVDALEAGLLRLARDRGLTWQAVAHGLGLGTAQAARQRYERLTGRVGGSADGKQEA
ncbi:DNA-binding protein [Micromonospora sp. B11E3]|uniref:DNA-binding protein n=1 Tax=Micromonospora sp. B11E3 TaxID=3153562 RepID=UPI00325D8973